MSNWEKVWESTSAAESGSFSEIPEGKYHASCTGARIKELGEREVVELEWTLENGRKAWQSYNLTEQGIPFLKKDLETLGHTVIKADGLELALEQINGVNAEIYIKYKEYVSKKDGQTKKVCNVFVNELLSNKADTGLPF